MIWISRSAVWCCMCAVNINFWSMLVDDTMTKCVICGVIMLYMPFWVAVYERRVLDHQGRQK